jgi:hypothetical protein
MATKSSGSRGNFRKGAVPGRGAVPANPPGNGDTRGGAVPGRGSVPAKPPANQGGTSGGGSDKK